MPISTRYKPGEILYLSLHNIGRNEGLRGRIGRVIPLDEYLEQNPHSDIQQDPRNLVLYEKLATGELAYCRVGLIVRELSLEQVAQILSKEEQAIQAVREKLGIERDVTDLVDSAISEEDVFHNPE